MSHRQITEHRFGPNASPSPETVHRHAVQFYESENYLREGVCRYLSRGFKDGHPMIVIGTPEHRALFRDGLLSQGYNLDIPLRSGQYAELDAAATLAKFMDGALPTPDRFLKTIGSVLENSRTRHATATILAYGEMVDILWRQGQCEAAIRLEQLWNQLATMHDFELLCAYAMNGFYKEAHRPHFENICRNHFHVIPTEQYMALNEDERLREIALLQQRASALESEIQHRNQMEAALLRALDERRQKEQKLRETETELRSVLQNAAEGLHWVGSDGRILWANQAELDLLGYSSDEYIGHEIREFHLDAEAVQDILARLNSGEPLRNYEARLRCKDGSVCYVLISSNVLRNDGKFIHTQCFTRDITELKRAENVRSFLTAVVESADDAIVSKDLTGVVTSWNPGAERIFGYSASEMIGKPIALLIPPDHADEEPRILERIVRGERIEHYETRRVRKDGRIIDISLTVSPIRDSRGNIIGASKIARDITEKKRIEAERDQLLEREQAARSEAEIANRVKDEFLAVLSHELRTPLNAIFGWTAILGSRKDEELVRRAVEIIYRNAEVQKRLIEDLLDMSRILTGKMIIKTETVDLPAVLNAAVDSVRSAAAAKAIAVDVRLDESVRFIAGDSDRLQQIVWNLLSNAIKFTPLNGTVELRLRKAGAYAEISVRDTGEGIAVDFLPHVFERFRQADGSTARQHGGLGLGLAVVQHLVEAHGGTVSANSDGKGRGATFVVKLPMLGVRLSPVT